MDIVRSTFDYEAWLGRELAGDVVQKDLDKKHKKMKDSAFVFLRATYWRWAEIILGVCPELSNAPAVLAVGDIHVENFGTWRDLDGRLVWGVNDFDEAAEMPFALDLVRLAVSAFLGRSGVSVALDAICEAILEGYDKGLRAPQPFVLDRDHRRMREIFVASEDEREEFWNKMAEASNASVGPAGQRYFDALLSAMPDPAVQMTVKPRTAGTGSLGRPRWVAIAEWKGGPVVREAKAVVQSGWDRARGRHGSQGAIGKLSDGRYRASDPWYRLDGENVLVRRLSPNSRKIEVAHNSEILLGGEMLKAMGRELANVHLGVADCGAEIRRDRQDRADGWLAAAAGKAARAIESEFEQWRTR